MKHKKVSLENMDFEKLFNVYSDDQISSRMILTPSIMQRLVDYNKKTGNYHSFLFTKNTVYIKMMISRNYMQVDTRKNILQNAQSFLKVYSEMRQVLTLAKDLNFFYLSQTMEQNNNEIKTSIL